MTSFASTHGFLLCLLLSLGSSIALVACGGDVAHVRSISTSGDAGAGGAGGSNGSAGVAGVGGQDCENGSCHSLGYPVGVSAGLNHACAVTANGAVKCWGVNACAKCTNATASSIQAVAVDGLSSGVVAVSAGVGHTCALTNQGGVKCWGATNGTGVLGNGVLEDSVTPVDVVGLSSNVVRISAGRDHSCALLSTGTVRCWGRNDRGQLGDNTMNDSATPVDVVDLSHVIAISAGNTYSCALTETRKLFCWGWNEYGQLGNESTSTCLVPTEVIEISDTVAISAGMSHTCAVSGAGAVKCWGANGGGVIGDNSITDRDVPVDVVGLSSGIRAVSAGSTTTCSLGVLGDVKCWGSEGLGNEAPLWSWVPVDVTALSSGVKSIESGAEFTCAVTALDKVVCWGINYMGQLGDNTKMDSLVPVEVVGL